MLENHSSFKVLRGLRDFLGSRRTDSQVNVPRHGGQPVIQDSRREMRDGPEWQWLCVGGREASQRRSTLCGIFVGAWLDPSIELLSVPARTGPWSTCSSAGWMVTLGGGGIWLLGVLTSLVGPAPPNANFAM